MAFYSPTATSMTSISDSGEKTMKRPFRISLDHVETPRGWGVLTPARKGMSSLHAVKSPWQGRGYPKTHTVKNWGPESTSSLRDSSLSPVHQLRLPVPVQNQS